jgi:hypothetical protein
MPTAQAMFGGLTNSRFITAGNYTAVGWSTANRSLASAK